MHNEPLTREDAKYLQGLPLHEKWQLTLEKVWQWVKEFDGNVYVSFSGGKDSTVLLHRMSGVLDVGRIKIQQGNACVLRYWT